MKEPAIANAKITLLATIEEEIYQKKFSFFSDVCNYSYAQVEILNEKITKKKTHLVFKKKQEKTNKEISFIRSLTELPFLTKYYLSE